jgi:hypothetical protein
MENLDAVPCENRLARLELEGKILTYVRETNFQNTQL